MSKKGESCRFNKEEKLNSTNCPGIDMEYRKERGGGLVQDVEVDKFLTAEALEMIRNALVEGIARGVVQSAVKALQNEEIERQKEIV